MADAEVGDDVLGDDPTVRRLEETVARLLGKQAALFVPSGTMGNQLAIRSLTSPGDEIIAHQESHIYHYEGGAPAALSGCSLALLRGPRGQFTAEDVRAAVRPDDCHSARSRLVVIENTQNRGGGSVWSLHEIRRIAEAARELRLGLHLDGARLLNACAATGHPAADYAAPFDTISICFSKGLGAPVGSALAGDTAVIQRAHRLRKMFGGGMRQSGILAAAAIYALDHHVERLQDDHANAKRLAEGLADIPGLRLDPAAVETNIVYFDLNPAYGTAQRLVDRLRAKGVWMLALDPQRLRAVTHLDVSTSDIDRALTLVRQLIG